MLIRFTVENFLSFKDEVEFSMVAGRTRRHKEHIIAGSKKSDVRLLKTAVIYGANASGKSNLIKAMSFARDLIVKGTTGKQRIGVTPFRFDSETVNAPSRFQFEIRCSGNTFSYGFEVDKSRVNSEWLFEIRSSSENMYFERETNLNGETSVKFGNLAFTKEQGEQFFEFVAKGTRENQLFLKECTERNAAIFADINRWFEEKLVLIFPETRPAGVEIAFMNDEEFQNEFVRLLRLFDLGIENVKLEDFDLDAETRIPTEVKEVIRQDIRELSLPRGKHAVIQIPALNIFIFIDENQDPVPKKFMTMHKVEGQDDHARLEIIEESEGTQRLFEIVPALLELTNVDHERVFVIDELDRRLHALLSYKILELFLTRCARQNSQLIVTTHEAGILDLELLRRDEVWFIEKNAKGVSVIYSLEEFLPRYDKDIRRSYLQGRFGAIPLLPSRRSLELRQ